MAPFEFLMGIGSGNVNPWSSEGVYVDMVKGRLSPPTQDKRIGRSIFLDYGQFHFRPVADLVKSHGEIISPEAKARPPLEYFRPECPLSDLSDREADAHEAVRNRKLVRAGFHMAVV